MTEKQKTNPVTPLRDAADYVQEDSQTVSRLLSEVVQDAQQLIQREFALARHEMQIELRKMQQAAIMLGAGAGILAGGGLAILFMAVYLLQALFNLNLWLAFLIVGVVLLVIGGALLLWGQSRLKQLDPVPRQSVEEVQEDVKWIQNQSQSVRK